MALWAKLEQWSDSAKKQNPGDFMRQGVFVLVCVLIAVAIDQYALEAVITPITPDFIPLGFYQVMLLPVVCLLAAMLTGPSKAIRISKAPAPTQSIRRR